jgi:hypothetical protein
MGHLRRRPTCDAALATPHPQGYEEPQLLIATGAFIVWLFALGGPFEQVIKREDLKMWGPIALAPYTFRVAFVEP